MIDGNHFHHIVYRPWSLPCFSDRGRGNVAEKSVRKVQAAVQALGYVRNVAAANLSRKRTCRLAFILPHKTNPFFKRMLDQLDKASFHLRAAQVFIDVIPFEAFDHGALNRALGKLIGKLGESEYDGVAVVGSGAGHDLPVLNTLRERGKTVVSLVSDLPSDSRDFYIGIDNVKAGRTAGRLIGMAHGGQPGRIVLTAGSLRAQDHADRVAGCRDVLDSDFPNIEVSDTLETRDRAYHMRRLLTDAMSNKGISGIYNVGAANDGLIDVLSKQSKATQPFCVAHELSNHTRKGLIDGVLDIAIDQRPEIELNRALSLLRAVSDRLPPPPTSELIPAIYLRDNLPNDQLIEE